MSAQQVSHHTSGGLFDVKGMGPTLDSSGAHIALQQKGDILALVVLA